MENMTDFDKLIIDYIKTTYKVSRIKDKMRFRRGMILDDGLQYLLKDEATTKKNQVQTSRIYLTNIQLQRKPRSKIGCRCLGYLTI